MKSWTKDTLQFIVHILLIMAAAYVLYADIAGGEAADGQEIGTVVFKRNVAQRKGVETVLFDNVENHAPVYNYDTIRTDFDSLAVLILQDGTEIALEEDTLIFLNYSEAELALSFSNGSFTTTRGAGDRTFSIISGDATISMDEGSMSLSRKDDATTVDVLSGNASITSLGKTAEASAGERAQTGEEITIDRHAHRLIQPAQGAVLSTTQQERTVGFSWEGSEAAVLEISGSRSFSPVAKSQRADGSAASVPLAPGTWYWRLRGTETGSISPVRALVIEQAGDVSLLIPGEAASFTYVDQPPLISFRWTGSTPGAVFTLHVARDANFSDIIVSQTTRNTQISESLDAGTYYWRIAERLGSGEAMESKNSAARSFTVNEQQEVLPPKLLFPADNSRISVLRYRERDAVFNWERSPGCRQYVFTLAADGSMSRVLHRATVTHNHMTLAAHLQEGEYFWNVAGIDSKGNQTRASETFSLAIVGIQPPALLRPAAGSTFYFTGTEDRIVTFRWNDPNNAKQYRMRISRHSDMRTPFHSQVLDSRSVTISALEEGTYYWRVELLNEGQEVLSASSIQSFSIHSRLATPNPIAPRGGQRVDMAGRRALVLEWGSVQGATHYRVDLFRIIRGDRRRIAGTETAANRFSVTNMRLLDIGSFIWEITALNKIDGETTAESAKGSHEFSIYLSRIPGAPRITSPEIMFTD